MPSEESGLAVIPIVVLASVIIIAGIFAAKGFLELKTPQYLENTALVYHSPSTTPSASVVASPSLPSVTSKKHIVSPSPSPSPSISPSPSPSGTPGPTATPQPGVYKLDCGQNCYFSMHISQSFSVGATLADSNGHYIANQSDFDYLWSIDDSSFGRLDPFDTCMTGVSPPCPFDHAILNPAKNGSTFIRLKVKSKSEGRVLGETSFNVTVD